MRHMPPKDGQEADDAFDLIVTVLALFFRLRAAGMREGAVTSWGGGSWGLMRSLALHGPQTVPHLARARPVARQRIQVLVNELAEAGLVEFIDNPHHKRSHLVRLTRAGETAFRKTDARVRTMVARLAAGLDPRAVRSARDLLQEIHRRLERPARSRT
jgi:DNA-binding MarR family transcriptional regulator